LCLKDEIPYSLAVVVEEMKTRKNGMIAITAVLHVERKTQKGILVGKGGSMIKKIGSQARREIEKLLDSKVFLDLWIKVSPHWKKNQSRLKEFGYKE